MFLPCIEENEGLYFVSNYANENNIIKTRDEEESEIAVIYISPNAFPYTDLTHKTYRSDICPKPFVIDQNVDKAYEMIANGKSFTVISTADEINLPLVISKAKAKGFKIKTYIFIENIENELDLVFGKCKEIKNKEEKTFSEFAEYLTDNSDVSCVIENRLI